MQNNMSDKIKHIIVGFTLAVLIVPLTYFFDFNAVVGWDFAISSVVFIGKEIYDKYKPQPTGFDKADLFCDYLGWLFGVIVAFWIVGIAYVI